MVAAAVGRPLPARIAAVDGEPGSGLPVYLATPETCRAFGAVSKDLPLHLLIDQRGLVGAVARGSSKDTLARLSAQAERYLDEVELLGNSRFAMRPREESSRRDGSR